jgi:PAS domain S-box-containing protein
LDRPLHILILEDSSADAELMQRELRKAGLVFIAQVVQNKAAFLEALATFSPDVLLADYSLPGFDGLTALSLAHQQLPEVPGIIVSGAIGEERAIEALKAGATDYVLKNRLNRLGPIVNRTLREARQLSDKKRAQEELARHQEWLRVTLTSIGDAVITTDTAGRITFLNPVAESLTGWGHNEAVGQPVAEVFKVVDENSRKPADDIVALVLTDRRVTLLASDTSLIARDGHETPIEDSAAPILDSAGHLIGVVLVFHDVARKRHLETERRITVEFLRLVNRSTGTADLVRSAAVFFQEQSGCDAVGIRMKNGDDYPYFEARGFPKEFVQAESQLCTLDDAGQVMLDLAGKPLIECMCGDVINGRLDSDKPFFTKGGSFWTNSTTEFLPGSSEAEQQACARNRCNGEGYESVALMPLQAGAEQLGLLQLNDRRKGMFTVEAIALWERLAGYLAVALARCRAQDALRENQALLQAVLDGSPDSIYVKDRHGRIITCNPALAQLTAKPTEEIIGRTASEYYDDPEVGQTIKDHDLRVMTSGRSEIMEETVPTPEGKRTLLSNKAPYRNASGEIIGIIGISRDITELKQTHAAAVRERANLQTIFDVVNVGLLLLDQSGVVKRVNDTVSKWVGKDRVLALGNQPGDIVGCIHALADIGGCGRTPYCGVCGIRQTFESVLRSGQPLHNVEAPATLIIDGKEVNLWLEISADPLMLDDGPHVILALNNITARKRAEEALHQTAEELSRSNKELEQFAYGASHDLQEPLRAISGFLGLLQNRLGAGLDSKAAEYLQFATDGANRMSQLIRDLLEYSRVQTQAREFVDVNMNLIFDRAMANCLASIRDCDAQLTCDGLPTIRGDSVQMVQLLQNLLGNALKFRRADRRPEIHVGAIRDGDHWQFWIKDNGIGIPDNQAERIFAIFQRLHTREEYPGTGIGLAICKKIVERHGGRIWVESKSDDGAKFLFTLRA